LTVKSLKLKSKGKSPAAQSIALRLRLIAFSTAVATPLPERKGNNVIADVWCIPFVGGFVFFFTYGLILAIA
jgi:hypothetical protein